MNSGLNSSDGRQHCAIAAVVAVATRCALARRRAALAFTVLSFVLSLAACKRNEVAPAVVTSGPVAPPPAPPPLAQIGAACKADAECMKGALCIATQCARPSGDSAKASADRQEYERALTIGTAACSASDGTACRVLAAMYNDGKGVIRDESKGREFDLLACEGGVVDACVVAGALLDDKHDAADHARADRLLQKGCDARAGKCCYVLAVAYSNGMGVAADAMRSASFLDIACKLDIAASCRELAISFHNGNGVTRSSKLAAEYQKKACDLQDGQACFNCAGMYLKGDGVAKNNDKLLEYLDRSCKLHNRLGCKILAGMACEAGSADACRELKQYEE
jgi:TPR repeat protein